MLRLVAVITALVCVVHAHHIGEHRVISENETLWIHEEVYIDSVIECRRCKDLWILDSVFCNSTLVVHSGQRVMVTDNQWYVYKPNQSAVFNIVNDWMSDLPGSLVITSNRFWERPCPAEYLDPALLAQQFDPLSHPNK